MKQVNELDTMVIRKDILDKLKSIATDEKKTIEEVLLDLLETRRIW